MADNRKARFLWASAAGLVVLLFWTAIYLIVIAPYLRQREMIEAVKVGDSATVRRLLERDPRLANLEYYWSDLRMSKKLVLLTAISYGHEQVAELLIQGGADVNRREDSWEDRTPLHYAARWGNTRIMHLLLAKGADANAQDAMDARPVMYAVAEAHREAVHLLIRAGAKPGSRIHEAAAFGDLAAVKAEVARNPKSVKSEEICDTPLSRAASHGHFDIARFLLAHGAKVDATIFRNAVRHGDVRMVRLLRNKISNVDFPGDNLDSAPLAIAAEYGHRDVVEYLLAEGADPTIVYQHRTALDWAEREGHRDVVKILERHGATRHNCDYD